PSPSDIYTLSLHDALPIWADMQFGGIMLHRELRNLAEVGLSMGEIIAAATGQAARALGMADTLGTIRAGMLADLLVVNADPSREDRKSTRLNSSHSQISYA